MPPPSGKTHAATFDTTIKRTLLILLMINSRLCQAGIGLRCDMIPEGVTSTKCQEHTDRYKIEISGNPEAYVPGEQYTVFLRVTNPTETTNRFTHFILSVTNENPEKNIAVDGAVGTLQLYGDVSIKFSERCQNAVVETDVQPKSEIQFLWSAPVKGSGCIKFKATVVESVDIWFSEDADLTKVLCEEAPDTDDTQPNILKQCCTCDEAKYESDHIRTIIKARGVSYPNITAKTFAVFRVDNRHHLMSIVSMIDPSPDWIVGVSGLELCLRNCTWIESKVLNLYPWDVGTDDGISYMSVNQPASVRQPIRRLKYDYPDDPRSPFYDSSGIPMKPFAKLTLSRQRLYEKSCDSSSNDDNDDSNLNCETTEWSNWSPCSATCGRGVKYKQRRYKSDDSKYVCHKKLTERASCEAVPKYCPLVRQKEREDPLCELGPWSSWSSCSVTCGRGTQTRDRKFKNRYAAKRCLISLERPPILQQNLECWGEGKCQDYEDEILADECPGRIWTDWSPCSATCGKGMKERYKLPVTNDRKQELIWNLQHLRELQEGEDDVDDVCSKNIRETVECLEKPCDKENKHLTAAVCSLPKDVGACKSNVDRWYFDTVKGQCEIFSYSGCEGNQNNFNTLELCQTLCTMYHKEFIANITSKNKLSNSMSYNVQNDATTVPVNDMTSTNVAPKIDCQLSKWGEWSKCTPTNGDCGHGHKLKYRHVEVYPSGGGQQCSKKMIKKKRCSKKCTRK